MAKKKVKFPSEDELMDVRERLSQGLASRPLASDASPVDRVKYSICEQIVIFKNEHKLTQRELAEKIGENESLISKVVHYNVDEFTIERLFKFLNAIYPDAQIDINVAS